MQGGLSAARHQKRMNIAYYLPARLRIVFPSPANENELSHFNGMGGKQNLKLRGEILIYPVAMRWVP